MEDNRGTTAFLKTQVNRRSALGFSVECSVTVKDDMVPLTNEDVQLMLAIECGQRSVAVAREDSASR